jgi:hypothetical protein
MSAGFARTEDWHGVSPIGAAPLPQIVQGFFRQRIETARGGIFLSLAVAPSTVKLGEPRPEHGEFRGGKSANGILDLSNRAHITKLTPLDRPAQPPWFLAHMGTIADTGFLRRASSRQHLMLPSIHRDWSGSQHGSPAASPAWVMSA